MATRSKVKILGSTYYITTQGSEEKVRKIEEEMNAQVGELMEQRPSLSALDALVMVVLSVVLTFVTMSVPHAVCARFKVEQVFKFYWTVVAGLALISLILVWLGL